MDAPRPPSPPSGLKHRLALDPVFFSVQRDLDRVDKRIRQQVEAFDPGIYAYVQYALESGGKRIRPALCLLSAHATGGCHAGHHDLAVIMELVHLASLVHDDVMDTAGQRRGKPTAFSKWGAEISVLLGDCLFAHALKMCADLGDLEISRRVAEASNDLCSGEILQTQRRFDLSLGVNDYLKIIGLKTGALFRVSTETAARLNKRPETEIRALSAFGQSLGVAYQMYDDCLDLFGSERQSGKTLGSDLKNGKMTLPVLHMLGQLKGVELETVSAQILEGGEAEHAAVLERIVQSGGHLHAVRKVKGELDRARNSLEHLQAGEHTAALGKMVDLFQAEIERLKA
jgi:octaprenyl-diphosphate synthase